MDGLLKQRLKKLAQKLGVYTYLKTILDRFLYALIVKRFPQKKYMGELSFWEYWCSEHGLEPETDYYRKFMMDMGDIKDEHFFDGLICIDIGCGPKGSLTWLQNARAAIGLDPLCVHYLKFEIASQRMLYLCSQAECMPLKSRSVDVVFSMNSLDHVNNFKAVFREARRVLKPGGWFIGSINLEESPTITEPWSITEDLLWKHLFYDWEKQFYKVRPKLFDNPLSKDVYKYFYEECPPDLLLKPGPKALWCRFRVQPSNF